MKDFIYYAPTEVVFGKDSEQKVAELVSRYGGTKVLIHYGGERVRKNGLLDNVCSQLSEAGVKYVLLGGVVPNPRLSLVREGIELCRRESVDFILAVGGGSVIDSAKAIGYGVEYDGDVWDFYTRKAVAKSCLPIGTVLTIPAAGSEMSEGSVITNEDGWVKLGYSSRYCRCKFAIMNPEHTFTLPPYQTAAGVVDIMMHTMERYFSHDDDMTLTDNIAEALLRTMMDSVTKVLDNPNDYRHRAQIMWAGSLAHNDLTGCGTTGDWATHQLGHELSGLFDATHGASLAAMWGSWARYVYKNNVQRFVRFAVNVMKVDNDFTSPEATALAGIQHTERFFLEIGMPINIPQLVGRDVTEEEIESMAYKCSRGGKIEQGMFMKLSQSDIHNIYCNAALK